MLTQSDLNKMSVSELSKLNSMIVSTVKAKRNDANRNAIYSFIPGDSVSFNMSSGMKVNGEVTDVKRTKVVVKTRTGNFLVPASVLNKCA